ncbi:hypothetical protein [uncultured Desulfovibrio sp.]|uniref:hypothetical protein n=1 Tax=uncultured Desulfovibrio sp. TaxID=167968 RepID=UPI00320A6FF3
MSTALYERAALVPHGWRRVDAPRYKKDYRDKYVTAEDFSPARVGDMTSPPDGAVCRVERRYSECAGQEFQLILRWHCPHCGLSCCIVVPESWIRDGRLVFVEREVDAVGDTPPGGSSWGR